jgi:hypothetical protein
MTLIEMSDGAATIIRVRPDKVELMESKGWSVVGEPTEPPAPPVDDDAPVALED